MIERCARTSKEKQTSLSQYLNETATETAWNAKESRDAWEQASWDEAGSWKAEEDQIEGSFADEDEEEALNLAGTHLNEAPASERETREEQLHKREQSCMISRVVVVVSILKVQTRKGSGAGKGKGKGQGENGDSRGRSPGRCRHR